MIEIVIACLETRKVITGSLVRGVYVYSNLDSYFFQAPMRAEYFVLRSYWSLNKK